ncbi:MAG TPA: iron uptake transporter deferrochelatase/peroxidase subunit [Stellaceae bacterium]|jgi:deferrochelatase/peroxidase EfeB
MTGPKGGGSNLRPTRRGLVRIAAGLAAVAGAGIGASGVAEALVEAKPGIASGAEGKAAVESFWGEHQGGIATPTQSHTYFAALDLVTTKRADVIALLRRWTAASARMAAGRSAEPIGQDFTIPGPDTGEALGLPPARLTLTFGFGAGLFVKDGKDRYGLAAQRPPALVDLPRFNGDQLLETRTGGDLSVQACADDPQVAFHAVRELARLADGVAAMRWAQTGFVPGFGPNQTLRNLMGFRDGTVNPSVRDPAAMAKFVWAGSEGPDWMRGGSYLVVRRIRMALEHWDRMKVEFQEQTFGRHKYSGAPLGGKHESDPLDLTATDKDGNPVIPESAHVRLAAAASNDGAQILRRPYAYNDGVNFTAERWPPWRQGMEYDAGLLFVCYQRDPRTGFIKIFDRMAKFDMLNQFVTHTGGGLFACPCGIAQGEFIGQRLVETA